MVLLLTQTNVYERSKRYIVVNVCFQASLTRWSLHLSGTLWLEDLWPWQSKALLASLSPSSASTTSSGNPREFSVSLSEGVMWLLHPCTSQRMPVIQTQTHISIQLNPKNYVCPRGAIQGRWSSFTQTQTSQHAKYTSQHVKYTSQHVSVGGVLKGAEGSCTLSSVFAACS